MSLNSRNRLLILICSVRTHFCSKSNVEKRHFSICRGSLFSRLLIGFELIFGAEDTKKISDLKSFPLVNVLDDNSSNFYSIKNHGKIRRLPKIHQPEIGNLNMEASPPKQSVQCNSALEILFSRKNARNFFSSTTLSRLRSIKYAFKFC